MCVLMSLCDECFLKYEKYIFQPSRPPPSNLLTTPPISNIYHPVQFKNFVWDTKPLLIRTTQQPEVEELSIFYLFRECKLSCPTI